MKYMGSKNRIAKDLVPFIQKFINTAGWTSYIEPFVGGANVIDKIKCGVKTGYDINPYLIALLKHVQEGKPLLPEVDFETYSFARSVYKKRNTMPAWKIGNIGFLSSCNGRFFDGGYAKKSATRDYYRESVNNILKQAAGPGFKDIQFIHADYREIRPKNSVVYCDPPYEGTKGYDGNKFDFEEFWDRMKEWSYNNTVLISSLEAPPGFRCVFETGTYRSMEVINRKPVVEKVFLAEPHLRMKRLFLIRKDGTRIKPNKA